MALSSPTPAAQDGYLTPVLEYIGSFMPAIPVYGKVAATTIDRIDHVPLDQMNINSVEATPGGPWILIEQKEEVENEILARRPQGARGDSPEALKAVAALYLEKACSDNEHENEPLNRVMTSAFVCLMSTEAMETADPMDPPYVARVWKNVFLLCYKNKYPAKLSAYAMAQALSTAIGEDGQMSPLFKSIAAMYLKVLKESEHEVRIALESAFPADSDVDPYELTRMLKTALSSDSAEGATQDTPDNYYSEAGSCIIL